jgi:heterodisulfide reductase subunit A
MGEGLDLDRLAARVAASPDVQAVSRHALLCSEDGQRWLEADLAGHPGARPVIAACSPREHGETFMQVCRRAGVNPYLLVRGNLREQCAWVTTDRAAATHKAERLVRSAVARALLQTPLAEQEVDCCTAVLVVGAGVAGLTAARQLAEGDRQVCLVDRDPAIGGRVARLHEIYPDLECASCMIEPLMDEVLHHPGIETFTYSEVTDVKGYLGNFTVSIRRRTRHVDPTGCYGCKTCHAACPVSVPNAFEEGLQDRAAIYLPYAGALPNTSLIDEASCLHFTGGTCDACVAACPFGNIDLASRDEVVERSVGAIVLATGAEPGDAPGVRPGGALTSSMTLERLLVAAGPAGQPIALPGRTPPRSVALVHDVAGPDPTTARTLGASLEKYAHLLEDRLAGGTLHELSASDRVTSLEEVGDQVRIRYTHDGTPAELHVDLAVVAPPLRGARALAPLAERLRVQRDDRGFVKERHPYLAAYRTLVDGILVAGSAQAARDLQETVTHAAAAAGEALARLVPGRKLKVNPATAEVDPDRCGGCRHCSSVCPYEAVRFDEGQRRAEVNPLLCQGCGACGATCPASAIRCRGFTDGQLWAEVEAAIRGTGPVRTNASPGEDGPDGPHE